MGVAVVVVPGDLFFEEGPARWLRSIRQTVSHVLPGEGELRVAADVLNGAKKVTILAGSGVAGAHDEVIALAEALQAPIVHPRPLRGKEKASRRTTRTTSA